jgi:penicillin-binding protein 1A
MARRKRTAQDKESPRKRGILGNALRTTVYWGMVLSLWGAIAFGALGAYVWATVPGAEDLSLPERDGGITVLAANGELLAHRGTFQGDEVRLDELPDYLPEAVIATEDRRFRYHFGVDPIGLARAMAANLRAGQVVQGGSTLTQQLAKNLFLKPDRTVKRKLQEMVIAVWLEAKFSKDEILQLYLNRVYFGAGAYGVDAAANRYFAKSAREVTLAEAAMLAGLLKAPTRYAPTRNAKLARARAALVLESMVEGGYITAEDGRNAASARTRIAGAARLPAVNYLVDWVSELVPAFVGTRKGELIVETTIDPYLQQLADAAVSERMEASGAASAQAAAVVMETDGAVKAMVGGRSYAASQFNRAVKAKRQPGSAFKPFVYLAAMEAGLTPDTVRYDRPVRFGKWQPANYNDQYRGPLTLRDALALSSNVIAATLAYEVGHEDVARTARRLGIASGVADNLSIALGTSEVSLVELTAAYAPFANGGWGVLPYVVHRITTRDGTVVYRREGSGPGRVIGDRALGQMNDMLRQAILTGTGRAAELPGRPAGGKTGTSQEFRDAWFVGYTTSLVTGIWVGNDDGTPMKKVTGGSLPAGIWRDIMDPATANRPVETLPGDTAPPDGNAIASFLSGLTLASRDEPADQTSGSFWQRLFGGGAVPRSGRAVD